MPIKKKKSVATKLVGFAIVIAVVLFGAKNQMQVANQQNNLQGQRSQLPIVVVPVDRSQLSQQLLPSPPNNPSIEVTNVSRPSRLNKIVIDAEFNQPLSQIQPSSYKLKLDDVKAWGSQPRRVSLTSTTRSAGSFKEISFADSQSPIVPGHEDPHLWYESQFLDLAVSLDGQQQQRQVTDDQFEFKALPNLLSDNPSIVPLPTQNQSAGLTRMALPPVMNNTAPMHSDFAPTAKPVSAPAARVVRTWETGRY